MLFVMCACVIMHFIYRCELCVDAIFTRPSAACPQCGVPLRRSLFRVQQFEDDYVEKDVNIRKKVLKEYIFNPLNYTHLLISCPTIATIKEKKISTH